MARTGPSLRLAVMGMIFWTGFVWGQQPAPAWGVDSLSTLVVLAWDMGRPHRMCSGRRSTPAGIFRVGQPT